MRYMWRYSSGEASNVGVVFRLGVCARGVTEGDGNRCALRAVAVDPVDDRLHPIFTIHTDHGSVAFAACRGRTELGLHHRAYEALCHAKSLFITPRLEEAKPRCDTDRGAWRYHDTKHCGLDRSIGSSLSEGIKHIGHSTISCSFCSSPSPSDEVEPSAF